MRTVADVPSRPPRGRRLAAVAALALAAGLVASAGRAGTTFTPDVGFTPAPGVFRAPVQVTAPAGDPGRLYVVQQDGLVLVVDHGALLPSPFLDLRGKVLDRNLAGLLSIAFPHDYERSGRFVVDYVGRDRALHVALYRSRGLHAVVSSARTLLRVPVTPRDDHFGGEVLFGPDGLLYVGIGDGHDPANAQDPSSLFGKLLRLDANLTHPRPRILAYGLRNPWRFSFDSATGDLYVGDVGADTWEEIDYLPHGTRWPVNLGWPDYGGRVRTASRVPLGPGRLVEPILAYRHRPGRCAAVVGGFVYHGSAIPALNGRYVYADFCAGAIWSLRVVRGRATGLRHDANLGSLLSSFGLDASGDLYACAYTYTTSRVYALR